MAEVPFTITLKMQMPMTHETREKFFDEVRRRYAKDEFGPARIDSQEFKQDGQHQIALVNLLCDNANSMRVCRYRSATIHMTYEAEFRQIRVYVAECGFYMLYSCLYLESQSYAQDMIRFIVRDIL
jgi:hypothetical protein